jgi:hypothetical protein
MEEQQKKDTIVGYRPDGTAVSLWQFEIDTERSLEEVKNGHFYTIEQLEEEFGIT